MAEPASDNNDKQGGWTPKSLLPWLPWVLVALQWSSGYGKRDTNLDYVIQQNADLKIIVGDLGKRLDTLSERVSRIDGFTDSLRRDMDQDRIYRDSKH